MKFTQRVTFARVAGLACMLALAGTAEFALGADPAHMDHPAVTKEMRAKMAAAHEQMAACLKSDRPIMECHQEMMKQHDEFMMHHEAGEHEEMEMHDCMHRPHHDHDHAAPSPPPAADAKPQ